MKLLNFLAKNVKENKRESNFKNGNPSLGANVCSNGHEIRHALRY
jgi:hypothetical protein